MPVTRLTYDGPRGRDLSTMTTREVPVSDLRAGNRVTLDDGREVIISCAPYRQWSGAVVVRAEFTSPDGPGVLERYPDDLVRVTGATR